MAECRKLTPVWRSRGGVVFGSRSAKAKAKLNDGQCPLDTKTQNHLQIKTHLPGVLRKVIGFPSRLSQTNSDSVFSSLSSALAIATAPRNSTASSLAYILKSKDLQDGFFVEEQMILA